MLRLKSLDVFSKDEIQLNNCFSTIYQTLPMFLDFLYMHDGRERDAHQGARSVAACGVQFDD